MGAPGKKMKDYRQAQIVRLDIIAQLYKRGYSYREIREEVMARLGLDAYSLRTVHKDVKERLKHIDADLFERVHKVLSHNKAVRHLRGGEATRRKYRANC